jgi:hypothetical protein
MLLFKKKSELSSTPRCCLQHTHTYTPIFCKAVLAADFFLLTHAFVSIFYLILPGTPDFIL